MEVVEKDMKHLKDKIRILNLANRFPNVTPEKSENGLTIVVEKVDRSKAK